MEVIVSVGIIVAAYLFVTWFDKSKKQAEKDGVCNFKGQE